MSPEEAVRRAEEDLSDGRVSARVLYKELIETASFSPSHEDYRKIKIFRLVHGREPTPTELQAMLKF